MLRVDLSVRQWYQKRAGLVGVFPIPGRALRFYAGWFILRDEMGRVAACLTLDRR